MNYDSQRLNWVVPARRAAVRQPCTYPQLVEDWYKCVDALRQTISRWYALDEAFNRGLAWLVEWVDEYAHGAAVAPNRPNTINRGPDPWVRLWKGPGRVLHHEESSAEAAGMSNDQREMRERGAEFFPGDLVEFPLHKFLAQCGLPGFDQMVFNRDGSPFLGNTVLASAGSNQVPQGRTKLHDNLLAMRFQLLLNLGVAAFYHREAVYSVPDALDPGNFVPLYREPDEPDALDSGGTRRAVFARGMMYAGTLRARFEPPTARGATAHGLAPPASYWDISNLHWGLRGPGGKAPACVPSPSGFHKTLPQRFPLTPGWACSPATLMLTFLMLNSGETGVEDVHTTFSGRGPRGDSPAIAAKPLPPNGRKMTRQQIVAGRQGAFPLDLLQAGGTLQTGDVNVAVFAKAHPAGGHERGFVKLYRPQRLVSDDLREAGPPHRGFLSAYHPVTGEDYVPSGDGGQFFVFSSDGGLRSQPANVSGGIQYVYGAGPFSWRLVDQNRVNFEFVQAEGAHGMMFAPDTGAHFFLMEIYSFDYDQPLPGYQEGLVYPPIAFTHPSEGLFTRNQSPDDFWSLYAERAVPFFTMQEFVDHCCDPPRPNVWYPNPATSYNQFI